MFFSSTNQPFYNSLCTCSLEWRCGKTSQTFSLSPLLRSHALWAARGCRWSFWHSRVKSERESWFVRRGVIFPTSWPLNNGGLEEAPPAPSQTSECNFGLPPPTPGQTSLSLCICSGLIPGPSTDTKAYDTRAPYTQWHRTMHKGGPLHPQTPNCGSKAVFSIWG